MEQSKYRELLESLAESIRLSLERMKQAAEADEERLTEYFRTYGDLYYRAPNSDVATDIIMLPAMASVAPKLKSMLESLADIQERLHGKPTEGLDKSTKKPGVLDAAAEDAFSLEGLGFKLPPTE